MLAEVQNWNFGAIKTGKLRAIKTGHPPDGLKDTALAQRSIKPLSRQKIREILDRYAGFPVKFHWETTVNLDGITTTTPITVEN